MTYKNTDNTVLESTCIGALEIGAEVVFHNDGLTEDIHVIAFPKDEEVTECLFKRRVKTVVIADSTQDIKYPFFHDYDKEVFVLKYGPSIFDLLFDED